MKLLHNPTIWIILLCVILTGRSMALAQNAHLTNIIVTNTRDDLLLYLNV